MSYQVFARKWRPQQFDQVVGQGHITTTLKNAIARGRVAHAYIFTGPRGIGKTSTARILAKALNCQKGPNVEPCDRCDSCKGIMAGNSMDVLEIDGASNRGIDQIRELRENVKFAPSISRHKVYIIDEVHQITHDAFNALLKTLEEPPAHVKFFFATTEPHKVPATILSRCQRFDLRSISPAEIVERLTQIARSEKIKIDKEACYAIARYAQGSMRDAESILDQLVSYSDKEITEDEVVSMLGLVREVVLEDMTDALIHGDSKKGLEIIARVSEEGKDLTLFLGDWIGYLRSIMLFLLMGESERIDTVSPDAWKAISRQSGQFSVEQIRYVLDVLTNAEQRMKWSLSPRIFLELSFLKAARARDRVEIGAILEKLRSFEERLSAAGGKGLEASAAEAARSSKTAAEGGRMVKRAEEGPLEGREETETDDVKAAEGEKIAAETAASYDEPQDDKAVTDRVRELWHDILDRIAMVKPLLKSYLLEGRPVCCKDGVLCVEFSEDFSFHRESLEHSRNKQLVRKVLSEKIGKDIGIRFELNRDDRKKEGSKGSPTKKEIKNIKKDPIIQTALEMFNAQVVDVKK